MNHDPKVSRKEGRKEKQNECWPARTSHSPSFSRPSQLRLRISQPQPLSPLAFQDPAHPRHLALLALSNNLLPHRLLDLAPNSPARLGSQLRGESSSFRVDIGVGGSERVDDAGGMELGGRKAFAEDARAEERVWETLVEKGGEERGEGGGEIDLPRGRRQHLSQFELGDGREAQKKASRGGGRRDSPPFPSPLLPLIIFATFPRYLPHSYSTMPSSCSPCPRPRLA